LDAWWFGSGAGVRQPTTTKLMAVTITVGNREALVTLFWPLAVGSDLQAADKQRRQDVLGLIVGKLTEKPRVCNPDLSSPNVADQRTGDFGSRHDISSVRRVRCSTI
jgi:hypothetical protein